MTGSLVASKVPVTSKDKTLIFWQSVAESALAVAAMNARTAIARGGNPVVIELNYLWGQTTDYLELEVVIISCWMQQRLMFYVFTFG